MHTPHEILPVNDVESLVEHVRPLIFFSRLVEVVEVLPLADITPANGYKSPRVALNTADNSAWYVMPRSHLSDSMMARLWRPDSPEQPVVDIRARRDVVTDDYYKPLKDDKGNLVRLPVDFMYDPSRLVWRQSSRIALELVCRGAKFRRSYQPAIATVNMDNVTPESAEAVLLSAAHVLTDVSYLDQSFIPSPLGEYHEPII